MRILVIDDQPDMLRNIARMLTPPHEIVTESDPERGVAIVSESTFDVLVTDIVMPGTDGIDVIKRIRRQNPDIWIVAMSGGGQEMSGNTVLTLSEAFGADRVLYKPFRKPELSAAIERS